MAASRGIDHHWVNRQAALDTAVPQSIVHQAPGCRMKDVPSFTYCSSVDF